MRDRWLIKPPLIIAQMSSLAEEHGLHVELHEGFHKFFYNHCDEHRALLSRMRVLTPDQPEFDSEQWEAIGTNTLLRMAAERDVADMQSNPRRCAARGGSGVYDVFVFRKR